MTKLISGLANILPEFENWYANTRYSLEDAYSEKITLRNLRKMSDAELIKFFVKFRKEGGHIQSGGKRCLSGFEKMLKKKISSFRPYVLEPFQSNFNLNDWLDRIKGFNQWGYGVASIYLVRVDKDKYCVFNNKTVQALKKIGFENAKTVNRRTYFVVKDFQKKIMDHYPEINNFYKADALLHFIVDNYKDVKEINVALYPKKVASHAFKKSEEEELEYEVQFDKDLSSESQLRGRIDKVSRTKGEYTTYRGKKIKRDAYRLALIKKLRNYECQFCGKFILKKDKTKYVEACHIIPKADGGDESLKNILILCPNCHKEFDYGDRKEIVHDHKRYNVLINGHRYAVEF